MSSLGQPLFDPRFDDGAAAALQVSGAYSSRRIARASVERTDFMMIVAGDAPDFLT